VGLAELGDSGGLAGAGRAGHDHASSGADLVAVEQHQSPAGVGDVPDGRRRDDTEPAVVGEAGVEVRGLVFLCRSGRLGRWAGVGVDEATPAFLGGEWFVNLDVAARGASHR
jgi:hypothetical protein